MANIIPSEMRVENQSYNYVRGAYLHGDIEDEVGFDLFGTDEPIEMKDSITIHHYNGKPVKLFLWDVRFGITGLACYLTDTESIEYATKMYNEKSQSI